MRNVEEIRTEDPDIGAHKLWLMLCSLSIPDVVMPGRDSFYRLLRRNGLILPTPKPAIRRIPTTVTTSGVT